MYIVKNADGDDLYLNRWAFDLKEELHAEIKRSIEDDEIEKECFPLTIYQAVAHIEVEQVIKVREV